MRGRAIAVGLSRARTIHCGVPCQILSGYSRLGWASLEPGHACGLPKVRSSGHARPLQSQDMVPCGVPMSQILSGHGRLG